MTEFRKFLRPAAWAFYAIFVFEILFMISPAALYFYSVYGPVLNFLDRSPATAWLTQFFLPHISTTASPALNLLGSLGGLLILAGLLIFLAAAVPLYWAKLRRRGAVTGGLYRFTRHPQYAGLAVMGLGTLLVWPRFLVLVSFVTMLFLYSLLARWEEAQCIERYGDSYRAYQARTGMFLPRALSPRLPGLRPASGYAKAAAAAAIYAAILSVSVTVAYGLRDYSLAQVSALYRDNVAVLSPARLTEKELQAAYRIAASTYTVRLIVPPAEQANIVVHVVPQEWHLPDLPLDKTPLPGGHRTSDHFERNRYKVLISRARTHEPAATEEDIVKTAHGLDPIVLVQVDIGAGQVLSMQSPPAHVRWGDIPTPIF